MADGPDQNAANSQDAAAGAAPQTEPAVSAIPTPPPDDRPNISSGNNINAKNGGGHKTSEPHQRMCPHCQGTGTCKNGKDQQSCASCIQYFLNPLAGKKSESVTNDKAMGAQVTCKCSVCKGRGFIEGATFKVLNYFPFAFAVLVVGLSFVAFKWIHDEDGKLQTALTTILGTIVGFYYGGKVSGNS
jgi:hypothetical protein